MHELENNIKLGLKEHVTV